MKPIGLYLHIPFCDGKCPYCDFYSVGSRKQVDRYTDALISEMEAYAAPELVADTLYLGGGTPPLLGTASLLRLIQATKTLYSFSGEATLEANPNSVTSEMLSKLRESGFNRISFGMQSALPEELKLLGRKHTPEQVAAAVSDAKAAGFQNISVDLMLGIPGQTVASAMESIDFLQSLGVQHLSAYLLKIEENTLFYRKQIGRLCPTEEECCDIYLAVVERLQKIGFQQYEISNFSLPQYESRHNMKYWHCEEYLGFGPAAHGYHRGVRYGHTRDLTGYVDNPSTTIFITEDHPGGFEEYAMLRLRLNEGLSLAACETFGINTELLIKKAVRFEKVGLLQLQDGRIRLTPRGFLVSNELISELIL